MSDFTFEPPLSWQQFYVLHPPLVFQPPTPPPDNYCTVPNREEAEWARFLGR